MSRKAFFLAAHMCNIGTVCVNINWIIFSKLVLKQFFFILQNLSFSAFFNLTTLDVYKLHVIFSL